MDTSPMTPDDRRKTGDGRETRNVPTSKKEPDSKKQEKPFLSLDDRRIIAQFLPRPQVDAWRMKSRVQNDAMGACPEVRPRPVCQSLKIFTYRPSCYHRIEDGFVVYAHGKTDAAFPHIEKFRQCCKTLEVEASRKLAGLRLFPRLPATELVRIRMRTTGHPKACVEMQVANRLTGRSGAKLAHFLHHIRDMCFHRLSVIFFNQEFSPCGGVTAIHWNTSLLNLLSKEAPFRFYAKTFWRGYKIGFPFSSQEERMVTLRAAGQVATIGGLDDILGEWLDGRARGIFPFITQGGGIVRGVNVRLLGDYDSALLDYIVKDMKSLQTVVSNVVIFPPAEWRRYWEPRARNYYDYIPKYGHFFWNDYASPKIRGWPSCFSIPGSPLKAETYTYELTNVHSGEKFQMSLSVLVKRFFKEWKRCFLKLNSFSHCYCGKCNHVRWGMVRLKRVSLKFHS